MTLSIAEIDAVVRRVAGSGASSERSPGEAEIRQMLSAVANFEFPTKQASPLIMLCAAGADYGWREMVRTVKSDLLADVSASAKANLRRNLRRDLENITRFCLDLEWAGFGLAMASIGLPTEQRDSKLVERMFLHDKPSHRLFSLFKQFPVLAELWCQSIRQWRKHVNEVLQRFAADRRALSRAFFGDVPMGTILNTHFGLSDRHNSGRTVVRLQFKAGSIIYKPRSGAGEWEWLSLLDWMNRRSFQPELRAARVLERKGYCWMEYVESASCKDNAAVLRFYQRIGGMIAAAYLLKLVDCHRDNLIASGEHPVLVDVDALWHVSPLTKTQSLSDVLYRTGFFPNANRRSLQSRSSVLGPGTTGTHRARIAGRARQAADYTPEIIKGFIRAWHCILGTTDRRVAFRRRLWRIRSRERRWLYRATEKYAAIRKGSIQPRALRSSIERHRLIEGLCRRSSVKSVVVQAEVDALKRLDIPYFVRRTKESMPPDKAILPPELPQAIFQALEL